VREIEKRVETAEVSDEDIVKFTKQAFLTVLQNDGGLFIRMHTAFSNHPEWRAVFAIFDIR